MSLFGIVMTALSVEHIQGKTMSDGFSLLARICFAFATNRSSCHDHIMTSRVHSPQLSLQDLIGDRNLQHSYP